jgi:hypothetical protein
MARYLSLMRGHGPSPVSSVIVTVDDVIYFGTYYVQDSIIHVQSQFGAKANQVGGARPQSMAKLLLLELVREAHAMPKGR